MTGKLFDWCDIIDFVDGESLLVGNGASINVWSKFSYHTLRQEATLTPETETVFDALRTSNFEQVLETIYHARTVDQALGRDLTDVDSLREEVRHALLEAVKAVHILHDTVGVDLLDEYAKILGRYKRVYTTNYDLLIYWATMASYESRHRLKDLFWNDGLTFSSANASVDEGSTPVYYLHGGLHLWMDIPSGDCGKWTAGSGSLLDTDFLSAFPERVPLFISEGTAREKLKTIGKSTYLRYATEILLRDRGNLVIFGSSLGTADEHILHAINLGAPRVVAVGMLPSKELTSSQARIREKMESQSVVFFDASSHPLGAAAFRKG